MDADKTTVIDKVGELHFVVTVDYPEVTEPDDTEPEPVPATPVEEKSDTVPIILTTITCSYIVAFIVDGIMLYNGWLWRSET